MTGFSGNPFSTSARDWKPSLRFDVFLSHSADCKDICETVKKYINDDVNTALRQFNLTIAPIMYEDLPPNKRFGNATESSLAGVESSSILFAFIHKKHGKIRNEEITYAISLQEKGLIQDVNIFFRKVPQYFWIRKEDEQVKELKEKLRESLTYVEFETDLDVIKKVSQIIMKAICELKKQEGQQIPDETLILSGPRLSDSGAKI